MRYLLTTFQMIMRNKHTSHQHLESIFLKSVESVDPKRMIQQTVKFERGHLIVEDKSFKLQKPCFMVGFGKAVLGMAVEIENILGSELQSGIVNVPTGIFETFKEKTWLPKRDSKIRFIEGAKDNLPDENAMAGAEAIKELAEKLEGEDLLIVLVSGGGSALLPLPKHPIKLEEKLRVIKDLSKRGANIKELNCVRKKLSAIKGGDLVRAAYPAKVVGLVLSDIVGDSLDSIASGPTATTPTWNASNAAWKIIEKYSLAKEVPDSVRTVLNEICSCNNANFSHVHNFVIGNNRKAALAALQAARNFGYESAIISTCVQGDVARVSHIYSEIGRMVSQLVQNPNNKSQKDELARYLDSLRMEWNIDDLTVGEIVDLDFASTKGICLIGAGEPTVVVGGKGKGGRNQELALRFSIDVNKKFRRKSTETGTVKISFLSCGTDGIDGPTDAAGAIGGNNLVREALDEKINPENFLNQNDSYNFYSQFRAGANLIKIGHTGTNVMDVHVMLICNISSAN